MVPPNLDAWITGTLVPGWVERAIVAGAPGYVEYLTPDGRPDGRSVKTTLVTARLVYVFSHAHLMGGDPACLAAAAHGIDFLLTRCRDADGRFRHSVQPDGTEVDGRTDLYDLAFVLFAVAWYVRATGERRLLAVADDICAALDAKFASPHGGFAEDDAGTLPRRQNPHMHLLEAFHALAETTREPRWLDRADAIVRLMANRLFDRETGSLGEYFTADWQPWPGDPGLLREPGHHFEWVWLLVHHARLTGRPDILDIANRLYAFGLRHGLAAMPDGRAVVLDGVNRLGDPVARTRLLWPQTEAVKAFAVRCEGGDTDAAPRLDSNLTLLFDHFVSPETGLWRNQLSAEGAPIPAELPIRVLYHLVLALAEVARVRRAGHLSQA